MGILLTIVAFLLLAMIAPIGILFGTIVALVNRNTNNYYKEIAIAIDQFGNVSCCYLFNFCLIKSNGYKFGNRKETISSVLGKNYETNTLTLIGKIISYTLNKLDTNHVIKSIDENVNYK